MFVVGLTGGIGSGKSAATAKFSDLGITIADADIASRKIVEPGSMALQAIAKHFGDNFIQNDGQLDRAKLRQEIFANPDQKRWLEELTHPLIRTQIEKELEQAESPYTILVSPLLLETNQHQLCDRILVVDVTEELQLERTVARDKNTEEQVRRIIASQATRQVRLEQADDIVDNSSDLNTLHMQIEALHKRYLELAKG